MSSGGSGGKLSFKWEAGSCSLASLVVYSLLLFTSALAGRTNLHAQSRGNGNYSYNNGYASRLSSASQKSSASDAAGWCNGLPLTQIGPIPGTNDTQDKEIFEITAKRERRSMEELLRPTLHASADAMHGSPDPCRPSSSPCLKEGGHGDEERSCC